MGEWGFKQKLFSKSILTLENPYLNLNPADVRVNDIINFIYGSKHSLFIFVGALLYKSDKVKDKYLLRIQHECFPHPNVCYLYLVDFRQTSVFEPSVSSWPLSLPCSSDCR